MTAINEQKHPIVLGITGASGFVYGAKLLKFFLDNDYKVDLALSSNALKVSFLEMELKLEGLSLSEIKSSMLDFINSASKAELLQIWDQANVAASISSGSYKTQGMIIAPCSMGTIANISAGTSNNLLARAADVTLKERRKLVLVARETPLSTIHLRNMLSLSEMGAIILPAAPGYYHNPRTIDDQINFVLGKTLDVFGIENELFNRWLQSSDCSNTRYQLV